ncbi:MAG: AsnC family transcriptional regulator [Dehalococcoidia bacterium]
MKLDLVDKRLLNAIQARFPLTPKPFSEIGERLDIAEDEAMRRVERLREGGIIRSIRAIFNSRSLGYRSTLAAMQVAPEHLDEVADVISRHPGVSHNYARDHLYNLWFVLTIPQTWNLGDEVDRLTRMTKAGAVITLPTLRTFKISVYWDLLEDTLRADQGSPHPTAQEEAIVLTNSEIEAIRALQDDLPLTAEPFHELAKRFGMDAEPLLELARGFVERGIMRRYSAILDHYRVGFKANAMGCWIVPRPLVDQVGRGIASFSRVSHVYERETTEDWPYNMFAMIHDSSREECEGLARKISEHTGVWGYSLLHSVKEYKKQGIRYFV